MKKLSSLIAAISLVICSQGTVKAQMCDTIANICAKHMARNYISDGQQYRTLLLNSEEYAEFHTTFFGETTYRIAACSGTSDGNLIFNIYDQDRRLLFTNRNHQNAPYWDFKIKSTLEAIIEAQLDGSKHRGSGCAVLLIGFKHP
jgi:hypothetical protein